MFNPERGDYETLVVSRSVLSGSTKLMFNKSFLPAEWEPQSHVMLTWPHEGTDWAPYLPDISKTYLEMSEAITRYERLVIATPHPLKVGALLAGRLNKEQMSRVYLCHCKSNDTWARDHGPITLKAATASPGRPSLTMLDFRFNGWGEKFPADLDNRITRTLHEDGAFDSEEAGQDGATRLIRPRLADHDDFVLEGGAIESDGKGTVFTTAQCLLAPHRNQPLSQEEIEQELRFRLKAKRIIWLHHGNLIGDDTDGHIDTIVRIAPNDTLLYHRCSDPTDEQYADFRALEEELRGLRTADGKPYTLIPLPQPQPIYYTYDDEDGEVTERLPASYANFLIINGAVIVPTYGQAANDEAACEAVRQAFPDRDIIPIDAQSIIRQHGSIHCCTMQIPK